MSVACLLPAKICRVSNRYVNNESVKEWKNMEDATNVWGLRIECRKRGITLGFKECRIFFSCWKNSFLIRKWHDKCFSSDNYLNGMWHSLRTYKYNNNNNNNNNNNVTLTTKINNATPIKLIFNFTSVVCLFTCWLDRKRKLTSMQNQGYKGKK